VQNDHIKTFLVLVFNSRLAVSINLTLLIVFVIAGTKSSSILWHSYENGKTCSSCNIISKIYREVIETVTLK